MRRLPGRLRCFSSRVKYALAVSTLYRYLVDPHLMLPRGAASGLICSKEVHEEPCDNLSIRKSHSGDGQNNGRGYDPVATTILGCA